MRTRLTLALARDAGGRRGNEPAQVLREGERNRRYLCLILEEGPPPQRLQRFPLTGPHRVGFLVHRTVAVPPKRYACGTY